MIFVSLAFLIITLLLSYWDNFLICEKPIEYFLLNQHILILLYMVITRFIMMRKSFKKAIVFLFCYGFPIDLILGVIGTYMQFYNVKMTPKCIDSYGGLVYFWLLFSYLVGIFGLCFCFWVFFTKNGQRFKKEREKRNETFN